MALFFDPRRLWNGRDLKLDDRTGGYHGNDLEGSLSYERVQQLPQRLADSTLLGGEHATEEPANSIRARPVGFKHREHRRRLFGPAYLITSRGSARVQIINISTKGALLHRSTIGPLYGQSCLVSDYLERPIRTVWKAEHKLGVRFIEPLTSDELRFVFDHVSKIRRPTFGKRQSARPIDQRK
jgi:hypothetical protein